MRVFVGWKRLLCGILFFTGGPFAALQAEEVEALFQEIRAQEARVSARSSEVAAAEAALEESQADLMQCDENNPPIGDCGNLLAARDAALAERTQAEQDLSLAQMTFERIRLLFEQGFATREELQTAELNLQSAEVAFAVSQTALEQAEVELAACLEDLDENELNPACDPAQDLVELREQELADAIATRDAEQAQLFALEAQLERVVIESNFPEAETTFVDGSPQATFSMRDGFVYQSQVSSNLMDWVDVTSPVQGVDGEAFVTDPQVALLDQPFYRFSVRLDEGARANLRNGQLP